MPCERPGFDYVIADVVTMKRRVSHVLTVVGRKIQSGYKNEPFSLTPGHGVGYISEI